MLPEYPHHEFIVVDWDGWEGLYRNGKLIFEDNFIRAEDVLRTIGFTAIRRLSHANPEFSPLLLTDVVYEKELESDS